VSSAVARRPRTSTDSDGLTPRSIREMSDKSTCATCASSPCDRPFRRRTSDYRNRIRLAKRHSPTTPTPAPGLPGVPQWPRSPSGPSRLYPSVTAGSTRPWPSSSTAMSSCCPMAKPTWLPRPMAPRSMWCATARVSARTSPKLRAADASIASWCGGAALAPALPHHGRPGLWEMDELHTCGSIMRPHHD
jgi:hypothetical protein